MCVSVCMHRAILTSALRGYSLPRLFRHLQYLSVCFWNKYIVVVAMFIVSKNGLEHLIQCSILHMSDIRTILLHRYLVLVALFSKSYKSALFRQQRGSPPTAGLLTTTPYRRGKPFTRYTDSLAGQTPHPRGGRV